MDPDTNLQEQLTLARRFVNDSLFTSADADTVRLAELVLALDQWIRRGGFLPEAWKQK